MQQKRSTKRWKENCEIDETAFVAAFLLAFIQDSKKTAIRAAAFFLRTIRHHDLSTFLRYPQQMQVTWGDMHECEFTRGELLRCSASQSINVSADEAMRRLSLKPLCSTLQWKLV